jgi:hypothetical protein
MHVTRGRGGGRALRGLRGGGCLCSDCDELAGGVLEEAGGQTKFRQTAAAPGGPSLPSGLAPGTAATAATARLSLVTAYAAPRGWRASAATPRDKRRALAPQIHRTLRSD